MQILEIEKKAQEIRLKTRSGLEILSVGPDGLKDS